MTSCRHVRLAAFICVFALGLGACGLKPGVHVTQGAFGPGNPTTGAAPGLAVPGGSSTGGAVVPGATAGTRGTAPAVPAPGAVQQPAGPADRTGITATTITIGVHAPVTGSAPISAGAFNAGTKLFWNWLKGVKHQKVFGRDVKVISADDQYTPTTAVAVCNQMATAGHAFLLMGAAGADQIGACAHYAAQRGIPYFSVGVQDTGLVGLASYFAMTMSYRQQVPLLLQLLKKENSKHSLDKYGPNAGPADGKLTIGFVRPDTGNFDDANEALNKAAKTYGFVAKTYTVAKEGSSPEATSTAQAMRSNGVDIAFPITAPVFTTQLAQATGSSYRPLYAGVAITNNINQEMGLVCGSQQFQGALWLSPWPGWSNVMAGQEDTDFKVAVANDPEAQKYNTKSDGGDIMLALWGLMKSLHQILVAAGPNVSRQSFIQTANNFKGHTTVFPDLAYTPSDHLGAKNTHVLIGDCGKQEFVTDPAYPGLHSGF